MDLNGNNIFSKNEIESKENDYTFRPKKLSDFVGQNQLRENLYVYIKAAKQRKESIDHILFSGPPGLGKTTLAYIIAREMGVNYHHTNAPAIEKKGDLAALLTKLKEKDVFFIDEIHRLRPELEEILYSAMEDYKVNIIMGQGISANSISIPLPKFTLVGATTRMGSLTRPLLTRFGIDFKLSLYNEKDIGSIVNRTAKLMDIELSAPASVEISKRSRGTPRVANRLMRRLRDFAQVHGKGSIDENITSIAFKELGIDELGFTETDRKMIKFIVENCNGGPVGLETIAVSLGETADTIQDVVEPYLIQQGYLIRTPRGRCLTNKSYNLPGIIKPESGQDTLF